MKSVTVLTPTYNRAKFLKRCYDSLLNQTNKDFEWIIVDDGSTDNTEGLVDEFRNQNQLSIRYVKKSNGGKHTALNLGFKIADSLYLVVLDSDDELTPNAIETILNRGNEVADKSNIGAIVFLKANYNMEIVGKSFPTNGEILSKFKQKHIGDKAEVFKTDLLKEHTYPEYAGETFIGESYVWDQIAINHNFVYYNEIIYLCDYLEQGLTKSGWKLRVKNPKGGMAFNNQRMIMPYPFSVILKSVILFDVYGCIKKQELLSTIKECNRKTMSFIVYPLSWLIAKYIIYKYR